MTRSTKNGRKQPRPRILAKRICRQWGDISWKNIVSGECLEQGCFGDAGTFLGNPSLPSLEVG